MGKGSNSVSEIIDIPGDGSAYLPILAVGPVRFVEIVESTVTAEGVANALQGFDYLLPNDGSTPGFTTEFSAPPNVVVKLGDTQAQYTRHGILLGNGADTPGAGQDPIPATILIKVRSATATGTSLQILQQF